MKRADRLLVAVVLLVVAIMPARADATDWSVGVQTGYGWVPMSEWKDFWSSVGSYHQDQTALYGEVYGVAQIAPRHGLRLSVERITTRADLVAEVELVPGPGSVTGLVGWDFRVVPICVSYEYTAWQSSSRASTVFGVGAGYYLSYLDSRVETIPANSTIGTLSYSDDRGGYGFHAYLRQTAPITDSLFASLMLRGRYADLRAFGEEVGEIALKFSGIDVAAGIEWHF
jgi:hypothetical protein